MTISHPSLAGFRGACRVSATLLLLVVSGIFLAGFGYAAPTEKPSVILITIDTLRADRIEPYGYKPAHTPAMAGLAEDGVTFERAIAQVPMTLPSHASILTATYPMFHGLRDVVGRLRKDVPMLSEWFQERGYATAAFVGASVLSATWGLNRGFEHYDDEFSAPGGGRVDLDRVERPAGEVVSRAMAWLEKNHEQPFFLWVHLFDPHDPYTPPEPFASQFRKNPYDGEIAYVDAELARLMALLRAEDLYEDSLIVFTADHGESLGEHREEHHAFFIYEAALRVPLILKLPQGRVGRNAATGVRVPNQVRCVDIAPTVVQVLGAEVPAWMQGESLLALMLGRRSQTQLLAYGETHYPRIHFGWSPLFSISNQRHKYIAAPTPELYDLQEDPRELRNIASQNQALANRMRDQLNSLTARYSAGAGEQVEPQVDSETLKQLQSLGYVGFSGGTSDDGNWEGLADPKEKIDTYNQLNQAIAVSRQGQSDRAVQLLQRVAESEPEMPIVHFLLGSEYLALNWHLKAIEEFRLTLKYNPQSGPARFNLAQAYSRAGLAEGAMATARELIKQDPAHYGARHLLASQLAKSGRLEEAVREEQQVVQLSPGYADGYNNLGAYLFSLGRITEAAAAYRRAQELAPDHLQVRINLSLAYLRLRQFDRALQAAQDAARIEPRASLAHFYMGQAYLGLGRPAEADSAFRRAKQLNPELEIPGS